MIDEIQVQNLALIRSAELVPSRGLTVLTGETGAGKTALLSALKLLMGSRASADLVRDGESGLVVSGRFFGLRGAGVEDGDVAGMRESAAPGSDAGKRVIEGAVSDVDSDGLDGEDECVVTRKVSAEGRSRASVNGAMASIRELGERVAPSIDLCGQFEHQQLMRVAAHVHMLDAWAQDGVSAAQKAYATAFEAAAAAAEELARVQEAQELSNSKLDEARFVLSRIDEVSPQPGEYEQLQHDLQIAEHAEALASAAASAHAALSDDAGALDALNAAASALEAMGAVDSELGDLAASLREAGYVLEDVSAQARDYRDKIDFDAEGLLRQQERLAQIQGLLKAYGPSMENVLARRAEAAEVVSLVDDSEMRLRQARSAVEEAETGLQGAADALDQARGEAAPRFAREVTSVMSRLEMGGAELVCRQSRLPRDQWAKTGPSSFEFLYRPAEGMQARPLVRIASGGEVSRVMLAVKVVLGAHDDVDTLVFDEVDAGVGGAVAVALADVIADLAATHQVIVVTHLAQVAVRGDVHCVVAREGGETRISTVTGADREREIARMLSGSATEASLAHAREMLERSANAG